MMRRILNAHTRRPRLLWQRRILLALLIIAGACALTLTGCEQGDYFLFYVVEEEEAKEETGEDRIEYFKDEEFDADKIVEDIWDSKVMPTMLEQAHDLTEVMEAIANDPEAAGEQYGYREEGGDYAWNFIVKGTGKIVEVNTRSRKGTIAIDLPPYNNTADATIWIGPIIRSTSIRDSLDFLSFTSGVVGESGVRYIFDTQVQFAEVSNALNDRGNKAILKTLEPAMCFSLTEESLQDLQKKDMPEDMLAKLHELQGQVYTPESAFLDAIRQQIGAEATEEYQKYLLRYADTNATGKGKLLHFYGAFSLQEDGEVVITPVKFEFVEEGQS